MDALIVVVAFVLLALLWGLASAKRNSQIRRLRYARAQARSLLTRFAQAAMEQNSVDDVVGLAAQVTKKLFDTERLFVIDSKGPLSISTELSGWFLKNSQVVCEATIDKLQGPIKQELQELMKAARVDVIMPLAQPDKFLAVLGLVLEHIPSAFESELLGILRLELTAACANVHLHHEVSHLHSLVDEVNVATDLKLSTVPEQNSGTFGRFKWLGHFASENQASSDFVGLYPLSGNRVLIVVGDSVGRKLAGSMVSAAVKSCCDQLVEDRGETLDPGQILSMLNGSLYRAKDAALASCCVAIIDPIRARVSYASAGHPFPYRLRVGREGLAIQVLAEAGPLLGDLSEPRFTVNTAKFSHSDTLLFLTDGLLAPRNVLGDAYGYRRFHRLLKAQNSTQLQDLQYAVLDSLEGYSRDAHLRDDQVLLLLKWT